MIDDSAFALVDAREPMLGTCSSVVVVTEDREAAAFAGRYAAARFTCVTSDGRELETDEEWEA